MKNSLHNDMNFVDYVIFNFLDHVLNTTKKSLLRKGLNFATSLKNINYADFMVPPELG